MKVWITKYALTSGIEEVEAEQSKSSDNMISYRPYGSMLQFAHGNEWHTTKEAAIARAEEMRIKKLQSLEKQIKKIRAIRF